MLSVSTVSAGAAASGYYKQEGYYKAGTPEAEKAASWFGKAAEMEGLTGYVDDKRFAELLDGHAPDGKLMGRYVDGERQHRPGLDLTFSASKSVSVAALVIGDERVIEAHDKAVRAAMSIVEERFIKTRWQEDGQMKTGNAEGVIAGIYRHDTSRALDPNLHSHAVIANMAMNPKGEYTAIRNEAVFNNRKLITEIYRSEFESLMREQGIATERGRYGEVNISGISQEVIDGFSKRRQEILASLNARGIEVTPANAAVAALATRDAKHKDIDRSELRQTWREGALENGMEKSTLDLGRLPDPPPPPSPKPVLRAIRETGPEPQSTTTEPSRVQSVLDWMKDLMARNGPTGERGTGKAGGSQHSAFNIEARPVDTSPEGRAVTRAIDHISERQSVYERTALTAQALRFGHGVRLSDVDREIDSRIKTGELFAKGEYGETLTDRVSVDLENSVLVSWNKAQNIPAPDLSTKGDHPPLSEALAAEKTLTPGQRTAIETSLTGNGRYVGVQGLAGTGKTFMVQKLTELADQSEYTVKGVAPSHQAVQELRAVMGEADTLAKIVMSERNHPRRVDNSRTILVVDESSMVSARDMRSLMDYADRTNAARVVFLGDTNQLDAVSAGQPFAQLQQAGMRTAVMDDIVRQKDDGLRAAVYDAVRGDIASAFKRLESHVYEAEDPRQAASRAYLALSPEDRNGTRILVLTNAARSEINEAVRDGLRVEGSLALKGIHVSALNARPMSSVEKTDARSYVAGDLVQSLVSSKDQDLQKNALYIVRSMDPHRNTLIVEHEQDKTRLNLRLDATVGGRKLGASLLAYQSETRELAAGDAVRVRITDSANGLTNGDRGHVLSTDLDKVTIGKQDGSSVEIRRDSLGARGLEHDYAATAHSVQGESVPRVLVAMNAREQLATQKSFYVEISRAVDEVKLFTDSPKVLTSRIEDATGIAPSALTARVEAAFEYPVDETVKAVTWAIEHVSERSAVYDRSELTVAAMRAAPKVGASAIMDEIDRRVDEGSLFASGEHGDVLTDKASVALESSILMTFHVAKQTPGLVLEETGHRSGEALLSKRLSDTNSITPGQRDAIQTALTGDGRYVGVQGYAGTGKTFMVDRLAHYAGQSGYEVKGYAPSHQAVDELKSVLGSADTLAKLVTAERHEPSDIDNSKTILLVDEASMIGSKDMRAFMNYAERTNVARVVFVGDTQQLDAVAKGQPFDQLQEAGMPIAIMDEIRRQRDSTLKQAVYSTIRGDISAAFERLADNVHEVEDPFKEAAKTYLKMDPQERAETRVLVLTNQARAEVSKAIRGGLINEGLVAPAGTQVSGLLNRHLTDAERIDARNYAPGDMLQTMVNSRDLGLRKDTLYRVRSTDPERNRLVIQPEAGGSEQILPLSAMHNKQEVGKSLVVYENEGRTVAEGDAVRLRITDKTTGVTNGMRGEITTTQGGIIEIATKDGRQLQIPGDSLAARGIEHDYAATAHAVQGETVDNVIVALSSTERLVNQKSFYVDISRARDNATLLTDDPELLAKTVERETGIRPEALAAWLESQRAGDKDDQTKDPETSKAPEKEPTKEKAKERDTPLLPGFEEHIKEAEKQAELILQRSKEIER